MLQFAITAYLDELKALGFDNVPSKSELSQLLGITPTSFSRMAANTISSPTRVQLGKIIAEFRRRGFDTTPNDLLRWIG